VLRGGGVARGGESDDGGRAGAVRAVACGGGWRISAGGVEVRVQSLGGFIPGGCRGGRGGGGGPVVAPLQAWVACWQWVGPEWESWPAWRKPRRSGGVARGEWRGCAWKKTDAVAGKKKTRESDGVARCP
jgi:hypothetical protein